jgi:uncharacterized protein YkwD
MRKLMLLLALAPVSLFAQNKMEDSVFRALNVYRVKHKLPKLTYSKSLSKPARHHATYLAKCTEREVWIYDHDEKYNLPDYNEYSFDQRSKMIRSESVLVDGEIQSQGLTDGNSAAEIIQAFHDSPPHREIMRKKSSKLVGLGVVNGNTVIVFGNSFTP